MTDLLRWALLELGLIYFVTESVFFAPMRVALSRGSGFLRALLYCPACSGFWLGALLGFLGFWPYHDSRRHVAELIGSGVAGMAIGALWATVHDNVAWVAEARARGEVDDDETTESEDVE